MAPKRPTPPPLPPPVASSEETASGSDSDESESEEESPVAPPAPVVSNKGEGSDSSGEEESEEEEEEDLVRSSATKSRPPPQENREEDDDSSDEEEGESSESDKAAPPPPPPPPPPPNPAPKQGAEGNGPKVSSPKRQAFHRIWSTEDEVRILEALAAHRREHGSLPQTDALIATLAGSLDNTGYGRKELQGKVSTLKRRYESTAKKKGDLPSKGHDRRLYDLSKSVWGSEAAAANGTEPREFGEMCELYPHLAEEVKVLEAAHPGLFKRDFGRLDDDKARALDMKIKKQRIAEISVVLRRGDLTKEVTKVLTELVE